MSGLAIAFLGVLAQPVIADWYGLIPSFVAGLLIVGAGLLLVSKA